MDPLSDVLSLLKPHSYRSGCLDAGEPWAQGFPAHAGIKCYAVVSGRCWLCVEGEAEPVGLETGDCFLLPAGRPFRLASDLALTPVDAITLYAHARNGVITTCNGGGDFMLVGAHFTFAGSHADMLLGVLPPIVHLREKSDQAALRWSLERLMQELRDEQPGCLLVAQHLAHMMLVLALRLHLAHGEQAGVGWLFALADKPMRAALEALHEDPARRWNLQALAERAGMSRSGFAARFKATVGTSPMDYLTRWRMMLAGDRLLNSADAVLAVALSLGYESESAFSTAFKRVMGCSPRQYGRAVASAARSGANATPAHADGLVSLVE